MKLIKLHRPKSQKEQRQLLQEEDNVVMQDTIAGEEQEFEVVSATSPPPSRDRRSSPGGNKDDDPKNPHQQPAEELLLKKQKFSLVRMFSSSSHKNNRNSHRHTMTNHPNHHVGATNGLIPSSSNQPFSPASTAASSTANTTMTFKGDHHKSKNKKHSSKFMKRLKKKTSDLFNFDGPTERITVGDEYAFISVKPKTGGATTNTTTTTTTTNPSRDVVVPKEEDSKEVDPNSNVQFKKQKFSLVRMFSSSATSRNKSGRHHGKISRTNSTPPVLGGSG